MAGSIILSEYTLQSNGEGPMMTPSLTLTFEPLFWDIILLSKTPLYMKAAIVYKGLFVFFPNEIYSGPFLSTEI